MCGIAGYVVMRGNRVRAPVLHQLSRNLMRSIEVRGRDAAGYGYVSQTDKHTYVAKAPLKTTDFLNVDGHLLSPSKAVKTMPWSILLHARAATKGHQSDNANNHPVYSKATNFCLIHNGWLLNDDDLAGEHALKKDGQVDTETYLRLIDKFYLGESRRNVPDAITRATAESHGAFACAMVQGNNPNKVWLWRTQNPIELVETDFGYVFASLMPAVTQSLLAATHSIDMTYMHWLNLGENQLVEIDTNGKLEVHDLDTPSNTGKFASHVTDTWENGKWVRRYKRTTGTTTIYGNNGGRVHGGAGFMVHGANSSGQAISEQPNLPAVVGGGAATPDGVTSNSPPNTTESKVESKGEKEKIVRHYLPKKEEKSGSYVSYGYGGGYGQFYE